MSMMGVKATNLGTWDHGLCAALDANMGSVRKGARGAPFWVSGERRRLPASLLLFLRGCGCRDR